MGELIELAESLRAVLEELARERSKGKYRRHVSQEENTAWCRLYRVEESIREYEREMARVDERSSTTMTLEG